LHFSYVKTVKISKVCENFTCPNALGAKPQQYANEYLQHADGRLQHSDDFYNTLMAAYNTQMDFSALF
jgi:hypothetical protein